MALTFGINFSNLFNLLFGALFTAIWSFLIRKFTKIIKIKIHKCNIEKIDDDPLKKLREDNLYFLWVIIISGLMTFIIFNSELRWAQPSIYNWIIITIFIIISGFLSFLISYFEKKRIIIILLGLILMFFLWLGINEIVPHYIHIKSHPSNVYSSDTIEGNTSRWYSWKILLLVHPIPIGGAYSNPDWYIQQQSTIPDANENWRINAQFVGIPSQHFEVIAIASPNISDISSLLNKKNISLTQIPDNVQRSNMITVKMQ